VYTGTLIPFFVFMLLCSFSS